MTVTFVEMPLEATSQDQHGVLILWDGRLAAVVSRLSDPDHGDAQGQWFLEAGFGRCAQQMKPFTSLECAAAWVEERLAAVGKPHEPLTAEIGDTIAPVVVAVSADYKPA